jgi:hypothetical protein
MVTDPEAHRVNETEGGENGTVFIALLSLALALFGAGYFMLAAFNMKEFPVFTLLVIYSFHSFFIYALVGKSIDSRLTVFSLDPEWGGFGFLAPENAFMALVPYGLFATVLGNAGYVILLAFFSP